MRNPGNTENLVDDDEDEQSKGQSVPETELDRWCDDGGRCPDRLEAGK